MPLQVILPCKPNVYKYITNRFGLNMPLALPPANWIKVLCENMLQRNLCKDDANISLQYYTCEVAISINMETYERYGDVLSKTAARAINCCIEDLIHEDLRLFIPHMVYARGYTLKAAITVWQGMRAMPEEYYSSDAIKKYYQRYIQPRLYIQKIIGVNVPFKHAPKNIPDTLVFSH